MAHVSVESHLSIKRTTEQVLEFGYRLENMDRDISEMISRCEICGARESKPRKNIATKHIESHRTERYQALQYSYQIILLEIQVRGIYLQLLIISVSLDMQL